LISRVLPGVALTRALGEWTLSIAGAFLVAIGMVILAQSNWLAAALVAILVGSAINAVGRSLQQPTLSSLVSKYSDPRDQGVVFGLFHGLSSLARAFGPLVAGAVYASHPTSPFFTAAALIAGVGLWLGGLRLARPQPLASAAVVAEG
jgi:predicted MFS family arabinose efflux permease